MNKTRLLRFCLGLSMLFVDYLGWSCRVRGRAAGQWPRYLHGWHGR